VSDGPLDPNTGVKIISHNTTKVQQKHLKLKY